METKKSKKANLENYKGIFFMVGLVVAMLIVYAALEFESSPAEKDDSIRSQGITVTEEIIPITKQKKKELPQLPKEILVTKIEIVDNEKEVEDIEIKDVEANQEDAIIAQPTIEPEEEIDENEIFLRVENQPVFLGKEGSLFNYISKNLRYPTIAAENGIQGTVYISFVVNEKGKVVNIKILRGVDPILDKEAIRIISSMPDWKPGEQRGRKVKVGFSAPIKFQLQ